MSTPEREREREREKKKEMAREGQRERERGRKQECVCPLLYHSCIVGKKAANKTEQKSEYIFLFQVNSFIYLSKYSTFLSTVRFGTEN